MQQTCFEIGLWDRVMYMIFFPKQTMMFCTPVVLVDFCTPTDCVGEQRRFDLGVVVSGRMPIKSRPADARQQRSFGSSGTSTNVLECYKERRRSPCRLVVAALAVTLQVGCLVSAGLQ